MAMVVQHNLTAMNANRQLGVITSGQAKSSEKLASGYRINRAGDDAAGLKISEKMRSQVRGLQRASVNAQDGVSLIQTAEGALNEAHSILQRMNELAVQGANDTNETIDREAINEELDQLVMELDRISSTTQFNKMNLLDGSFQSKNLQVGANADQKIAISINNMNAETLGLKSIKTLAPSDVQSGVRVDSLVYNGMTYQWVNDGKTTYDENLSAAKQQFKTAISNKANSSDGKQYVTSLGTDGSTIYKDSAGTAYGTLASAMEQDVSAAIKAMSADLTGNKAQDYLVKTDVKAEEATVAASYKAGSIDKPDVSDYVNANATITAVQNAINKVSSQRSALGAIQNRLEHTIANLDNVAENTQAAESRIRDTDIASEMVEYSKNQILAQAGQSMLAQGNQATQGVLSLLQ